MSRDERAAIELGNRQRGMDPVTLRLENLLEAFRANGPEVARCVQELVDSAHQASLLAHGLDKARETTVTNRFQAIDDALLRLREAVKRFNPCQEP